MLTAAEIIIIVYFRHFFELSRMKSLESFPKGYPNKG